ncbi:hypothetical protein [Micromonospora inaquosa]|uniref:hypothetical protein n=1 Tax=Micromonospora inaquosa TaxID=2203716 RepID=UPI001ABF72FF|nr:hypothetical protein [Micromonospora inaquosa]
MLTHVRAASGDVSPTALDLRRNIGILLVPEDKPAEDVNKLQPLHDDVCVVDGPEHELTREVADLFARLRLAADG